MVNQASDTAPSPAFDVLGDPRRLAALERTGLLDSPPSEALDRITRLAAYILDAPISLLSLVDAARQFFASEMGLPEPLASRREMPLSHSFCKYVVTSGTPLVVPDARDDPLVYNNQAVTDFGVLSYAGMPLTSIDGLPLGSFCVVDHVPRQWSERELTVLRMLADVVAAELNAREQAQLGAQESERRFRLLAENAHEVVSRHGPDGRFLYVSPACRRVLGYEPDELLGKLPSSLVDEGDVDAVRQTLAALYREPVAQTTTVRARKKDGELAWLEVTSRAVRDQLTGEIVELQLSSRDITDRKRFEDQLLHVASRDALTGLYNRRRFVAELERSIAQERSTGALLSIDLDYFKDVNDALGPRAGDEVLASVAALLKGQMRDCDMVARIDGDQFAVLQLDTSRGAAEASAVRVHQALSEFRLKAGPSGVSLGASIGIAVFPEDGITAMDILTRADLALAGAKAHGRGRSETFQPEHEEHSPQVGRLASHKWLRDALREERLVLYGQPILDLKTNRITHSELLLRVVQADGRLVLPGEFIPFAEESGLIKEIDRWVVARALTLVAEPRTGDLVFALNLSGKSCSDDEILALLRDGARTVDPRRLIVEVTETAAIQNILKVRGFMDALQRLGYRFALDDFGVGFSSFYELKHLPVDYIKIDGSFVKDLVHDVADQHLVKAMAAAARGLGKKVVAEFVGDEATVGLLRDYGVDYAQGYGIGKPVDVREMLRDLAA